MHDLLTENCVPIVYKHAAGLQAWDKNHVMLKDTDMFSSTVKLKYTLLS